MKRLFLIIVVLLVGCSSNATQNIVSKGTTEIKDMGETEPIQASGLAGNNITWHIEGNDLCFTRKGSTYTKDEDFVYPFAGKWYDNIIFEEGITELILIL